MPKLTADEIKQLLNLRPLPLEGGYYAETYRSRDAIPETALPSGYKGQRAFSTAIYFLLTSNSFSAMHKLPTDEVFHFYLGDPVQMLQIAPDGTGRILVMGQDLTCNHLLQVVVPANHWQGTSLLRGGAWALLGTTMAPGFEFEDYQHGDRSLLVTQFPQLAELIISLTRD